MPLQIVRPGTQLSDDKRKELGLYLMEQWRRAKSGRQDQVDAKYQQWQKAYSGVPLEEIRTVPFYKASNFVVKLIRMYLDTFTARTLNILFATKPLYVCDGLPQEIKDAYELYLNRKACYEWAHYNLCKQICQQGNKNGTAITKTPWTEHYTWDVNATSMSDFNEKRIPKFLGPESCVIPFDDFYIYPITTPEICCAEILFHRLRFVKEKALRMERDGDWQIPEGQSLAGWLHHPKDVQRQVEQTDAGVTDPYLLEMEAIECHLDWELTNEGKDYSIVATLEPNSGTLLDVYYNPYPGNLCIFQDYRPYPRDDIFFGESMSELLGQSQEEASRIHNERRDNSTIASSVCFKRRSGSLIPNPSTNWYPGKVWDLEDMTDLDTFDVGRNYENMIEQEDYTFQLAEKLSGIGELMQGASQGMLGRRGVYNTGGTLSVIAEGNQRQDTNIRDVRCVMGGIAKTSARLQALYGDKDPFIDTLPQSSQDSVRQAMAILKSDRYRFVQMEVKASSAGANTEVRKANLMMMAQQLGQYGQQAVQAATELANQKLNPAIRQAVVEFVNMQRWMAKRLLKELDEWDATEILPDPAGQDAQRSANSSQPQGMGPGGAGPAGLPISRGQLETLAALPPLQGNGAGGGGMEMPNMGGVPGPQRAA